MGREGNSVYLTIQHSVEQTIGRIGQFFELGNVELACEFALQCLNGSHIVAADFFQIPMHLDVWYNKKTTTDKQADAFIKMFFRFTRDMGLERFSPDAHPHLVALRLLMRSTNDIRPIDEFE
jgi:hypothetical protein